MKVPPLSLQTLVENSVKYAVAIRNRGGSISVRAIERSDRLRLEVHDDGPGFASLELPSGHGLSNLQERIAALFEDVAKLDITSLNAGTVVAIELPLPTDSRVGTLTRANGQ